MNKIISIQHGISEYSDWLNNSCCGATAGLAQVAIHQIAKISREAHGDIFLDGGCKPI
jgi:hypothetical protein